MITEYEIGKKLKAIREEKGLSQSKVVKQLVEQDINMSRSTCKIETNSRSISAIELNALCNIFDIDIRIFHEEEGWFSNFFRRKIFLRIHRGDFWTEMAKVFQTRKKYIRRSLMKNK